MLAVKVFDFSDEAAGIDISEYLVLYLYVIVMVVDKITYKLPSESLKELFIRL